jgi:hypothetical protein
MEPKRLTARVAPYVGAIFDARRRGVTWGEISVLFAVKSRAVAEAYTRARAGIAAGRYAVDQRPLPEPEPQKPRPPHAVGTGNHEDLPPLPPFGSGGSNFEQL